MMTKKIESDISRNKIESKINEMKSKGYEYLDMKILGPTNNAKNNINNKN